MSGVIVLHSGGVDSTALLYKLLSDGALIHALHVNLHSLTGSSEYDTRAVVRQWEYLKSRFTFTTSLHGSRFTETDGIVRAYPAVLFNRAISIMKENPALTHVTSGRCAEDEVAENRTTVDWAQWAGEFEKELGRSYENDVRMFSPLRSQTKAQNAASLPKELLAMTWGCMAPRMHPMFKVIGPCHTCECCRQYLKAGIFADVYFADLPS
jgi:7-cyano-7-deazaguanine synthase in queuosine biosynthesis